MYCYNCGAQNEDDNIFCYACGVKLVTSTQLVQEHLQQEDKLIQDTDLLVIPDLLQISRDFIVGFMNRIENIWNQTWVKISLGMVLIWAGILAFLDNFFPSAPFVWPTILISIGVLIFVLKYSNRN
jgi:uncharacterized membrane protein YvbJ